MNLIPQLKKEIDSVIFKCTPPDWVDIENPYQWSLTKFKTEMELCQARINNLVKPNVSSDDDKDKIREIKRKVEEKINDLESQLADLKGSEKKDMESRISNLKNALSELDTLLNSTSEFQINSDSIPYLSHEENKSEYNH